MADQDKDQNTTDTPEAEVVEDAVVIEEVASEDVVEEVEVSEPEPEMESAEVAVDPSEMQPAPAPARRGSVLPMILGGIVAGGIGFGAATYLQLDLFGNSGPTEYAQETRALTQAQADRIAALEAELKRVEEMTDQSGLSARLEGISTDIETRMSSLSDGTRAQIETLSAAAADLAERLKQIEARPLQDLVSDASVEAYEAEMAKLRAAIAEHRADIEAMAADARESEAVARAESLKSKGAALLTDLTVAVSEGHGYTSEIASLVAEGVEVPAILRGTAADGVPTQSQLIDAFPEAARAALSAIRQDTAGEGGQGGVMAFLQDQLGVRSVAPKEGDGPDAILSRAEAALKAGDLAASLSEIAALPEIGQAKMAEWVATAKSRADALSALELLKQSFTAE